MKYKSLGSDKLRVSLSAQEALALGLSFEPQDAADLRLLKRVMLRLLAEAREATGLTLQTDRLSIEIYPEDSGGCTVLFKSDGAQSSAPSDCAPMVFAFDNAGAMIDGAIRLFAQHGHRLAHSALYQSGGWRLVIVSSDGPGGPVSHLLSEYGRRLPDGAMIAAQLEEHAAALLPDRAVDTLSYYFDR
ncbi:MAG: hypothetical protein RRY21_04385 [Oscillospiraceae bacterium]